VLPVPVHCIAVRQGGDGDGSAGSARLEALSRYGATSSGAGEGSANSGAAGGARKGSRWGGYADGAGTTILFPVDLSVHAVVI
jgi:hypothetical protein